MRLIVLAALLFHTAVALAQPADRQVRIGHLSGLGSAPSKEFLDAFRDGMRSRGYSARRLAIEERYADGDLARLPRLAKELVDTKPDLLLTSSTPGAGAAKKATSTIPIVIVLVADPVGAGIVASLARPGGNITGITNNVAELAGKRLELLKQLVPGMTRVGVIVNPDSQNAMPQMRSAEAAASRLGIQLVPFHVRRAEDLSGAIAGASEQSHAALRMIDPLVFNRRKETVALAAKHRLPVAYPTTDDADAGGLIAYGANSPEQFRQAAVLVDKILQGAKPADMPIEQPTRFDLVVNRATAKALGITIPPAILTLADRVID